MSNQLTNSWKRVAYLGHCKTRSILSKVPNALKQVAKVTVNLVWCVTEGSHSTLYTGKCKYDLTYIYLSRYSPAKVIDMIWPSGVDTVHEVELHSSKQLQSRRRRFAQPDMIIDQPVIRWYAMCVINQTCSIGASYDQSGLMRCECDQSITINRGW